MNQIAFSIISILIFVIGIYLSSKLLKFFKSKKKFVKILGYILNLVLLISSSVSISIIVGMIFKEANEDKITLSIILTSIVTFLFSIISQGILSSALVSDVARKIGFRNITRRISNTILVVIGSMVGAALISGSLVLSDSLQKTSLDLVRKDLGEIDLLVSSENKQLERLPYSYISEDQLNKIVKVLPEDEMDGILPHWSFNITPQKLDESENPVLNVYQVSLIGLDQIDIENFGTNPQYFNTYPSQEEVILPQSLAERLEVSKGENIRFSIFGNVFDVRVIEIYENQGILGSSTIIIDKNYLENSLDLPKNSSNNIWLSANGGIEPENYNGENFESEIEDKLSEVELERISLNFQELKSEALDGYGLQTFVLIFVVLSLFGIFAGILLIINLFTMLAEERKYEMGILRAIALTRMQLTKTFVYEGYLYAIISALVGSIVGIGVGYVLVTLMNSTFAEIFNAFSGDFSFDITFGFEFTSLFIAFLVGTLITITTAVIASFSISRLNIVSAIRNLKESSIQKVNLIWILITKIQVDLIIGSIFNFIFSFFIGNILQEQRELDPALASLSDSQFQGIIDLSKSYTMVLSTIVLIFVFASLVNRVIKAYKGKDNGRKILTIASSISIIVTLVFTQFDFVGNALEEDAGVALLFVIGINLVISLSILITRNLDILIDIVSLIFRPFSRLRSVLKISLRYPAENIARTTLTVIMFSTIIYLIVFTSFNKSLSRNSTEQIFEQTLGGYELLIIPGADNSKSDIKNLKNDINKVEGINEVTEVVYVEVSLPEYIYKDLPEYQYVGDPQQNIYEEDETYKSSINGLPEDFIINNKIELQSRADGFESDEDIWQEVISDKSKVVLGVNYVSEILGKRPELDTGESFKVATVFGDEVIEYEVIGLVKQNPGNSDGFGGLYQQIITTNNYARELFSNQYNDQFLSTQILVDYKEDVDTNRIGTQVRKQIINYNIFSLIEVSVLTEGLVGFINGIILMLQSFMAFSLVVGASGLAIIMTRSVNERRQQIGMLRSLGFQKSMILISFYIESTFISLLGILVGISMGSVGAYTLFNLLLRDSPNLEFSFPVGEIAIFSLLVYVASMLFSILPAIRASNLSPVEATNYPE